MATTSTRDLIKIGREAKADAILLVFSNPQESGTLSKLAWKIGNELRRRGVRFFSF